MNKMFFILFFISLHSFAQNANISQNKIMQFQIFSKAIPDAINYFSIFSGPSLGNWKDAVDENGVKSENSLETWNQVSLQWKLNKKLKFVINPRFSILHNPIEGASNFKYRSLVAGISGTWYKNGNLSFSGGLNTILPFTRESGHKNKRLFLNPGGFNSIDYKLNDKFKIGTWIWGRALFYENGSTLVDENNVEKKQNRFSYFLAPTLDYKFNPNFSMTVFYQMNGALNNVYSNTIDSDDHFNVMANINIGKNLTLMPMITSYRASDFSLSKSNLNVWISSKFL